MSGEDELRARLVGLDPARPGGPADAPMPSPAQQQEHIMSVIDHETQQPRERAGSGIPWWRRRQPLAAGLAALALVAGGAGVAGVLNSRDVAGSTTDQGSTVALQGPSGEVMASCIRFEPRFLRDMPVALAGVATAVAEDEVTLRVTRWYAGSAEQRRARRVTISRPSKLTSASLDAVKFTTGKSYLVAATNGTVNGCGFSGLSTPQLLAAYDQAFGKAG